MVNYNKMLQVNFFLRGSESAAPDKKLKIYAILELDGYERDTPFTTNMSVPKKFWKGGYVDQEYIWAEEINQNLQEICLKLKTTMQLLKEQGAEITYKIIREVFSTKERKIKIKVSKPFLEVFDLMLSERNTKKKLSAGTLKNYRTVRGNLEAFFVKLNSKNPKIDDFTLDLIDDFLYHFRDGFGEDHINKHCWAIRRTFEYAIKRKLMKPIPIWDLELKASAPQEPHYIIPSWREALKNVSFPSLQDTKNIAIFLWSTGFSYTDYLTLEPFHLIPTEKGMCFKKARGKTKNYSLPPLLPDAAAIIAHYGGIEFLPRPHINDFNIKLKILGEIAGISDDKIGWHLSSSACRDTFSSMMENEYMVDSRVVMAMMGWTNPRQMRAYSTVHPERVMHELVVKGVNLNLLKLTS